MYQSMLPLADKYVTSGLNVILISDHGVGKTTLVSQIAEAHGLKVKYYSCATLDPFTDLVGVPFAEDTDDGKVLKMVRPRSIDEAEMIFFDELNRADPRVLNAVLEIVQFGSINGEPLPNLKLVWAAVNPPTSDQDYEVETLDPALLDRFDVYETLKPTPSVKYLSTKMPHKVAVALVEWCKDHNRSRRGPESYVSPRRLEKIGTAVVALGTSSSVAKLLPPGGNYDTAKLQHMLQFALTGKVSIKHTVGWYKSNTKSVLDYLNADDKANVDPLKVASTLAKIPAESLDTVEFGKVLAALPASMVESKILASDPTYVATFAASSVMPDTIVKAAQAKMSAAAAATISSMTKDKFTRKFVVDNPAAARQLALANSGYATILAGYFKSGWGDDLIAGTLWEVLESLPAKTISNIVSSWGPSKRSQMRNRYRGNTYSVPRTVPSSQREHYKVLQANAPKTCKALGV